MDDTSLSDESGIDILILQERNIGLKGNKVIGDTRANIGDLEPFLNTKPNRGGTEPFIEDFKLTIEDTKSGIKRLPVSLLCGTSPKKVPSETGPVKRRSSKRHAQSLPNRCFRKTDAFRIAVKTDLRDRVLSLINVDKYHHNLIDDPQVKRLLTLSRSIQRSQLDSCIFNQTCYFMATWLTSLRLFEYHPIKNIYIEAKRIPERYIDIKSNLITCVHHNDSKLYIAYMSNEYNGSAFVEIRDMLTSRLIGQPHHYEQIISSMDSDDEFLYIMTVKGVVHIHNKDYFKLNHYKFDPKHHKIINFRAIIVSLNIFTQLDLYIATERCFMISTLDALGQKVRQIFELDPKYRTISAHFIDGGYVIIHRSLVEAKNTGENLSKLDIGMFTQTGRRHYFALERSISFNCDIIQIEVSQDKVFLFSRTNSDYQLTCLDPTHFKPLWSTRLEDVDHNCRIIAQRDHVIIFKGNQEHFIIKMEDITNNNNGTLGDIMIELNKSFRDSI